MSRSFISARRPQVFEISVLKASQRSFSSLLVGPPCENPGSQLSRCIESGHGNIGIVRAIEAIGSPSALDTKPWGADCLLCRRQGSLGR